MHGGNSLLLKLARATLFGATLLGLFGLAPNPGAFAQEEPRSTLGESTEDLGWLEGNWRVGYDDPVLGAVTGTARVRGGHAFAGGLGGPSHQIEVDLVHPKSGATYRLSSFRLDATPRQVEIHIEGRSPPSELRLPGEPVEAPVEGATALPVPIGATVTAKLGAADAQAPAVDDEVPSRLANLVLTLDVPEEGVIESLDGRWRYDAESERDMRLSRAGAFERGTKQVTGAEHWTRPDPVIQMVATLGQPNPDDLRQALDNPAHPLRGVAIPARAEFPPDGLGRLWLSIAGTDLPVQPRRRVEFSINDPKVVYTGAFRRNTRYPDALDVEVVIREGLENTPKPLQLNVASGFWLPDMAGNEPLVVQHVRQDSETAFDPVETLYLGEVFFVQAIYAEAPFADSIPFSSVAGEADATLNSHFALTRVRDGARGTPPLYRSPPLLLLAPDDTTPSEMAVVKAADGATLKTAETDAVEVRGKPVAVATIAGAPPTLWEQALDRARACRASGGDTEVTNYIMTEFIAGGGLKQTIKITLGNHAAAILARDELARSLDDYVGRLNAASPVDHNAPTEERARQQEAWSAAQSGEALAIVDAVWNGRRHPLLNGVDTVNGPDGEGDWYTLDVALSYQTYFYNFGQNKPAFIAYARRAIAEAKGKMLDHSSAALKRARAPSDCDVVELLKVVGIGTQPVIARLLPRLVRPARGDEPTLPRVVPDSVARAEVAGIDTLAAAVAAQTEYSKLDSDAIIAAATLPFIAGGALVNTAAMFSRGAAAFVEGSQAFATFTRVGEAVVTASDLYDVYSVGRDTIGWAEASEDAAFGLGISGIAGTERFRHSQEEARNEAFGVAMGAGLSILPNVAEGIVSGRIEMPSGLRDSVQDEAMRNGVDGLDASERAVFDRAAAGARQRAEAEGPENLSAEDRATLAMADADAAGRATGPTGEATRPSIADPPVAPDMGTASAVDDGGLPPPSITRPTRTDAPNSDAEAPIIATPTRPDDPTPKPPEATGITGAIESGGSGRIADSTARPTEPPVLSGDAATRPTEIQPPPRRSEARASDPTTSPTEIQPPPRRSEARASDPTTSPTEIQPPPRAPDSTRSADASAAGSRTEAGDLRRPRREANAGAPRPPNQPRPAKPRKPSAWDQFDDSDLARSFDNDTIVAGRGADVSASTADGVGRGGYVYKPDDAARLADQLRASGAVRPEHIADTVEFWRRAGIEPDAVMAGRAFNRNLDPATSGVAPARMRENLDRYLRDHERITDAARRAALIDGYMKRFEPPTRTARLDEPDLPPTTPRADGTEALPPPDLPPTTPRADGTEALPPPDLPSSQVRTELLPPPDLPPSSTGTGELSPFKPDASDELSTGGPLRNVDSDGDGVLDQLDDSFDPIAALEEQLPPPKSANGSSPSRASGSSSDASGIPLDSSDLRAINQPANAPPPPPANAGAGPFDSSSIPPSRRVTRPVANARNLEPETVSKAWQGKGDGSFTVDGKPIRPEPDVMNRVKPPEDADNAFSRKPRSNGLFADVRRMRDADGKPTGHVSKTYGERRHWERNPKTTVDPKTGRCTPPPCWVNKLVQTPAEARARAEDTLHGARVLEAAEIPQLEIVAHDLAGHPPRVVQRALGENMPKTADGRVVEEAFGDSKLNANGHLEAPYEEAFAALIGQLKREGIFWEDMHLGNVIFQKVTRSDGTDYWRAGISDTDRIDLFGHPRGGREPNDWMRSFEEMPDQMGLPSRAPDRPLRDSEDAVIASLEHKGHLKWDPVSRCFVATTIPLAVLKTQLPGLKACPGRSSEFRAPSFDWRLAA